MKRPRFPLLWCLAACCALASPASADDKPAPAVVAYAHFDARPGVVVTKPVEKLANGLGEAFREKTGKRLLLTSGKRSARSQAAAMRTNLESSGVEAVVKIYADKTAVREIAGAYSAAKEAGKSAEETVAAMEAVIARQTKAGTYISSHLRDDAFDIRTHDPKTGEAVLSDGDAKTLGELAKALGLRMIDERVLKSGKHLHFQKEDKPKEKKK